MRSMPLAVNGRLRQVEEVELRTARSELLHGVLSDDNRAIIGALLAHQVRHMRQLGLIEAMLR